MVRKAFRALFSDRECVFLANFLLFLRRRDCERITVRRRRTVSGPIGSLSIVISTVALVSTRICGRLVM